MPQRNLFLFDNFLLEKVFCCLQKFSTSKLKVSTLQKNRLECLFTANFQKAVGHFCIVKDRNCFYKTIL